MESRDKNFPFVNWNRIFSFDAPITFVMTARNRGKSYGLRLQVLKDWENDGSIFVNLYRTKDDLKELKFSFFDECQMKIPEYRNYVFEIRGNKGYIAVPPKKEGDKPVWQLFCLFLVLGDSQRSKQHMFANVKRVILDEALITKDDPYKRYLPNEWKALSNLISTISRQLPGEKTKVRVYLLCNPCGLYNPYFQAFGITDIPPYGETWINDGNGKLILFFNEKPPDGWAESISTNTIAGRMLAMSGDDGRAMNENIFADVNEDFISQVPKNAEFQYALVFKKQTFGIWIDWNEGWMHVSRKTPKKTSKPIYVLQKEDARLNYLLAKKNSAVFRGLAEAAYGGLIRYESQAIQAEFALVLQKIGVA